MEQVQPQFDIDALVSAYVAIRDEREDAKAKFEQADGELKEQMGQLEAVMLTICHNLKVESIKTEHGLLMKQLKERYICGDWDNFGKFVVENNLVGLLEKRIHQGNFKKFMEEHTDDGLPPGVNTMREYTITVRRPTGK